MPMMREQSLYFLFVCVVSVALPLAEAQAEPSSEESTDQRKASERFKKGEALFEAGDYAQAAQAFLQAHEIASHPSVISNIALSYDRAGKYPEAVRWYRQFLMEWPNAPVAATMRARLKTLGSLVGELRVTCASTNCKVWIDGVAEGPAPLVVVVLPGSHYVEAVVRGQIAAAVRISALAGEVVDVELGVMPTPSAEDSLSEDASANAAAQAKQEATRRAVASRAQRASGIVLMLAGGAVIVAGVALDSLGYSRYQDLEAECSSVFGGAGCPPDYRTERRSAIESSFLAGDILLGTGIAVAASGVLLALLAARSKPDERGDSGRGVSWFVLPWRDGGGVGVKVPL